MIFSVTLNALINPEFRNIKQLLQELELGLCLNTACVLSCVWNQQDRVFFFQLPPCRVVLYAGQCTAGICHSDLFLRLQSHCYRNLNRQTLGVCREPSPRCLLPNIHINISHWVCVRSESASLDKEPLKHTGFSLWHRTGHCQFYQSEEVHAFQNKSGCCH